MPQVIKAYFFVVIPAMVLSLNAVGQFVERKTVDVDVTEVKRDRRQSAQGKQQLNRSYLITAEVEKKLISGINKTITFYERQYKRMAPGSAQRLSVLSRILDLNLEQASYVRNEEERRYDDQWNRWDAGGRKGREPKLNTKRSFSHWQQVVNWSDRILKEFPRNKDSPRILFTKGFALSFLGKADESARIYSQIIQTYPKSEVAGDAYSALGDYYFDRNDFQNARNNYQNALRFRTADRYLWSIFKIAWCNYNLGQYDQALMFWKQVVREGARSEKGLRLRDEALRDMVYAFAEKKDVMGAIAYYRSQKGTKYLGELLLLLSNKLAYDGNFPEALKTLKIFQRFFPYDPQAPETQKEYLALSYELGRSDDLWKEIILMNRMYGPKSPWMARNRSDKQLAMDVQNMIRTQSIYYPKVMHKRAQQNGSAQLHREAKKGYQLFLKLYPGAKETIEVKFNIADIDYYLKEYELAGRNYLQIASVGPKKAVVFDSESGKPNSIHRESSIYMVDAYARDFQDEFAKIQKLKPDFKKPPRPLTPKSKNYIRACLTYMKFYPKDQKLAKTCEVDVSRIYYHMNDQVKARRYFFMIAMKYPKHKEGAQAVESLIPMYADSKGQLLKVTEKLLEIPQYTKGDLGKRLRDIKNGVAKEAIATESDPMKKAKAYEEFARKNPRDPEADILLYKAADFYIDAGAFKEAVAAFSLLVKRYPKSSQAKSAIGDTAQLLEKLFMFDQAIQFYTMYAKRYPEDKQTVGALGKTCDLLIIRQDKKAYGACLPLQSKVDAATFSSILVDLAMMAKRINDGKSFSGIVRNQILKSNQISVNQKIIFLYDLWKQFKDSKAPSEILSLSRGADLSGQALRYATEVLFDNAKSALPAFAAIKLQGGDVNKLQSSIEKKSNGLVQLKNQYNNVLATKDSYWGVAALYQLGLAHEHMAMTLSNPPAVEGAKPEDVKAQLKPDADAMTKEAANYIKEALNLIKKFSVYSEYSVKVVEKSLGGNNERLEFKDWMLDPVYLHSSISRTIARELR